MSSSAEPSSRRRPGTGAPFDLMVDDIDAAHRDYAGKGLSPAPVSRGRIHNSFELAGPDGWRFTVNSSHASGQPSLRAGRSGG